MEQTFGFLLMTLRIAKQTLKWFFPVGFLIIFCENWSAKCVRKQVSSLDLRFCQLSASYSCPSEELFESRRDFMCKTVCVRSTVSTRRSCDAHCATARSSWCLQVTDSSPSSSMKMSEDVPVAPQQSKSPTLTRGCE